MEGFTEITNFPLKQKQKNMKKHFLLITSILFLPLFLYGQSNRIVGIWLTEEGTSQVEIYKGSDGKYHGKIVWLDEPYENGKPKIDDENPDPKLAKRPIMGLSLVKNFKYSSKKKQWVDGVIYDPDNGKTYDCYAWFENGNFNTLYLKGYVMGIRMLGRSTVWKRERKRS